MPRLLIIWRAFKETELLELLYVPRGSGDRDAAMAVNTNKNVLFMTVVNDL